MPSYSMLGAPTLHATKKKDMYFGINKTAQQSRQSSYKGNLFKQTLCHPASWWILCRSQFSFLSVDHILPQSQLPEWSET